MKNDNKLEVGDKIEVVFSNGMSVSGVLNAPLKDTNSYVELLCDDVSLTFIKEFDLLIKLNDEAEADKVDEEKPD